MKFKTEDLVLRVSPNFDPNKFDIGKYEKFLEALAGPWYFQKEAIEEITRFLLGGGYKNTEKLAKENFNNNSLLQEYYGSLDVFLERIPFKEKLACTIDLATGTGKSYVIYGLAQIFLCEGVVDQVLVLCPSVTIEQGLTEKFKLLSGDSNLKSLLPRGSTYKNPRIINASNTIKAGDICVENVHAVYDHVSSSIDYCLVGKGKRTLVINDEAHHVLSPSDRELKEWKKFLLDSKYNFKYIVGDTGTAYVGNEYFADVVYRYPIIRGIEEKFIKKIRYLQKDESKNWDEKIQVIYRNHQENKKKFKEIRPITIFITQYITGAEKLAEDIQKFLMKEERISLEEAEERVIVVTSSPKHEKQREILKDVDEPENKVEWITSVSMLTEGWDVDNVFQIVPHEKRAFDSKLLISQVLGRGLRIPQSYRRLEKQPPVIVYNHDKWSEKIKNLVEEVIGLEKRIRSYVVSKDRDYNFFIHQIDYMEEEVNEKKTPSKGKISFPKKISLSSQREIETRRQEYTEVKGILLIKEEAEVAIKTYPVNRLAHDIYSKLKSHFFEKNLELPKNFLEKKVSEIINKSLEELGERQDWVSEENKRKIEKAFGVIERMATGTTTIQRRYKNPYTLSTKKDLIQSSIGISHLWRERAFIYEHYSISCSKPEDKEILEECFKDKSLPRSSVIEVPNKHFFRCPQNTVVLSHGNEIEFVERLLEKEIAESTDSWIKSPDRGFYSIPYSWRKNSHQKPGEFNPDFFIKKGKDILIVEIKSDEDLTAQNKGKLAYAKLHFEEINRKQNKQNYYFKFLSPEDFTSFFDSIKKGRYKRYRSNLEADLED